MRTTLRIALVACAVVLLTAPSASAQSSLTVTADMDAYVRTDVDGRRNDNYGCNPFMNVGTSRGGGGIPLGGADAERTLIHFDLSSVSAGVLTSAFLETTFYAIGFGTGSSTFTVDVHRVVDSGILTPWIEGNGSETSTFPSGCVGVDPAFGVAWVGAGNGGDANNQTQPGFDPAVVASAQVRQSVNQQGDVIRWDVTALVNQWLAGSVPNFGLVLRDGTTDFSFRELLLSSRQHVLFPQYPPVQDGPRLVLTFAPAFACSGFESPMNNGPVAVKQNRALPFKAQLFDARNAPVTGSDIAAPPTIQVLFTPVGGGAVVDVTDEALPSGQAMDGNQFVFTTDNKWQYNLKTNNYTAPGTYQVSMVSGSTSGAYVIQPTCQAEFVVK